MASHKNFRDLDGTLRQVHEGRKKMRQVHDLEIAFKSLWTITYRQVQGRKNIFWEFEAPMIPLDKYKDHTLYFLFLDSR